jgi:hypothetical protein
MPIDTGRTNWRSTASSCAFVASSVVRIVANFLPNPCLTCRALKAAHCPKDDLAYKMTRLET